MMQKETSSSQWGQIQTQIHVSKELLKMETNLQAFKMVTSAILVIHMANMEKQALTNVTKNVIQIALGIVGANTETLYLVLKVLIRPQDLLCTSQQCLDVLRIQPQEIYQM